MSDSNNSGTQPLTEEQQVKVSEVRRSLGKLPDKLLLYCSEASIARYLVARNWNVKKATKMLKETLKWRLEYKPEEIRWEDVAKEAETGKIYRSNYVDRYGRTILVMRPGCQV
uniref:Random slug protein 5 n=1 Tax=Anthurium amnicola TaxID=1678845 RepID=A0A1D1YHF0_9ARAE